MKTVHSFDYTTGLYLGPVVLTDADLSPLEQGVFLLPGNCTELEPPAAGDGERPVWTDDGWALQTIPQTESPVEEDPQVTANLQARAYLANTDWYVIRQLETGQAIPTEVQDQRQQARDSIK